MHDSADLGVEALEVLCLFIELDVGDPLLKVECVSHLVEEESKEKVSPVSFECQPSVHLGFLH